MTGNDGGIATAPFSVVVTNPPLAITTTSLPQGEVGVLYPTTVLAATGGAPPLQWSLDTGSLPPG